MKKFLFILLLTVIALVITGYACSGMLKRFVLAKVQEVAAEYLNPTLVIEDMAYHFPFTVQVSNLSLEQDGVKIVEIPSGTITLEGIPYSEGQVRFKGFDLVDPLIRFQVDPEDNLVGWGDLIKDTGDDDDDDDSTSVRNSDAFAVRMIKINNGTIEYADTDNPNRTMRLDEITLEIDAHPGGGNTPDSEETKDLPQGAPEIPTGQNWYRINSKLDRAPIISIALDGALDIDTGDILIRKMTADTALDPDKVAVLPPQIQEFVESNNMRGALALTSWGAIRTDDPLEGPVSLEGSLTDASFSGPQGTVEVEKIDSVVTMRDGVVMMPRFKGSLLGGTIDADAELFLEEQVQHAGTRPKIDDTSTETPDDTPAPEPGRPIYSLICGLQLDTIDLGTLTSTWSSDERLRGELNLDVEMNGVVTRLPQTLAGTGICSVTKGRLANIPVISALGRLMNVVLLRSADNDQLEIDLELRPDGVVMPRISVVAGLMAVRGRGIVRFNDTIDLVLNGGPMERLQESIGAIGRALGSLTDRIVRYQVTGQIGDPSVRVRPLGINVGDPTAPPPDPPEPEPDATPPVDPASDGAGQAT
jgi:hypothetical protein